ncbi:adenylate kinase [Metapseudomonas furukawaii]|uniref:adenylate kinase n=1 Tax=Metapseudomonas furukawaii TaxID=1149133 RepID=UPI00227CCEC0|nr:adenylate kinase [Pseudomonas furukawaii]WAG78855.1 adenylate kinase [Pseudomonas furukawaii]
MDRQPDWPGLPGQRISIVGCSGSGKTTLARELALLLDRPHIELDALFHQRDWQPLPRREFRRRVTEALAGERWIVEGSYGAVRPEVLARADTQIWLDPPRAEVMRNLLLRSLGRVLLRTRLWNGNRERLRNLLSLDPGRSIILWGWTRFGVYRARFRAEHEDPELAGIRRIRLGSRREVRAFLRQLRQQAGDGRGTLPPSQPGTPP